jgi:hypothetical protein
MVKQVGLGRVFPCWSAIFLTYDMYGGCPGEDPIAGDCTYLGEITVNPISGEVTAQPCSFVFFNSGVGDDVERPHIEVSAPSAAYCDEKGANPYFIQGSSASDDRLCCRDIGSPGGMKNRNAGETDNKIAADECIEGGPCCVAVHWQTEYDAGCTNIDKTECDLVEPITIF